MPDIPTLTTERLTLRPFTLEDAPAVTELAGAVEIAATTDHIPHPYELKMAVEFISRHEEDFARGLFIRLAPTLRETGQLLGAIALAINPHNRRAELGYWIGKPYWNNGFATEAAREIVKYGFEQLNLNRIQARHMTKNPPSGRVLLKIDMKYEGTLRQSILKWDQFEDVALYASLKEDFERMKAVS
ncbi:GNAT family N-acetyltransferase [Calditrichota bacterium]